MIDVLHKLPKECWEAGRVPKDMAAVLFRTLRKKNEIIFSNFRSAGLLPHVTKILTRIGTQRSKV